MSTRQKITLTRELFHGIASLEEIDGVFCPYRLPHEKRKLFPSRNDGLMLNASFPTGGRIRFNTDAENISVGIDPRTNPGRDVAENKTFDLVIDNEIIETLDYKGGCERYDFAKLQRGEKVVEIWLGHYRIGLKHLEIDDGASFRPAEDTRKKWVTYGSSITFDDKCESPARNWPSLVAREKNLNLTSLGFGGNCHLEPMIALYMRDLPADLISIKVGINIYGGSSLSYRTFRSSIIGFIQILREKHATTPIAVISPIISPPNEDKINSGELSLKTMREQIEDAVELIKETCGDKNIFYFNGLDLFNEKHLDHLPDDVHPDAEGSFIMAENFIKNIYEKMDVNIFRNKKC